MDNGGSPLATVAAIAARAFIAAIAFGWLSNDTQVAPKPLDTANQSLPLQTQVPAVGADSGESALVLPAGLHEADLREPDVNSGETAKHCLEAYRRAVERHVSAACKAAPPRPAH